MLFIFISGSFNHGTVSFFACQAACLMDCMEGGNNASRIEVFKLISLSLMFVFLFIFLLALLYFLMYLRFFFICLSVYVLVSVFFFTYLFPKPPYVINLHFLTVVIFVFVSV